MTPELVTQHWALVTASVLGWAVVMFVAWRAWLDSARGRLRSALRRVGRCRSDAVARQRSAEKATATLARMQARVESVKPRRLQEAAEAVQDAEALLKIATDQVLIAENHVRRIIVEEFPPKRHDVLRSRYLQDGGNDGKPFSF